MRNSFWLRIILFYLVAIGISNVFRFNLLDLNSQMADFPGWTSILVKVLLEGSGIFTGGLIALYLLSHKRKPALSLLGTEKAKSIFMVLIPLVLLSIFGINNKYSLNEHYYALIAGSGSLIYCLMEELGWRAYLQDELIEVKPWKRYLLIGSFWYLWHLSFLTDPSILNNLIFLGMMILGSWGIGQVAIGTRSLAACSCFHFIINIIMFNQLIGNGISGNTKLLILGFTLSAYILLLSFWKKSKAATTKVKLA